MHGFYHFYAINLRIDFKFICFEFGLLWFCFENNSVFAIEYISRNNNTLDKERKRETLDWCNLWREISVYNWRRSRRRFQREFNILCLCGISKNFSSPCRRTTFISCFQWLSFKIFWSKLESKCWKSLINPLLTPINKAGIISTQLFEMETDFYFFHMKMQDIVKISLIGAVPFCFQKISFLNSYSKAAAAIAKISIFQLNFCGFLFFFFFFVLYDIVNGIWWFWTVLLIYYMRWHNAIRRAAMFVYAFSTLYNNMTSCKRILLEKFYFLFFIISSNHQLNYQSVQKKKE